VSTKAAEPMLYLDWFVEQYDVGLPNPDNFAMCIAYLQGMLDSLGPDDNRGNLVQCIGALRSAEVMARTLKQYQVRMPHG
jgi:hypothetical protein